MFLNRISKLIDSISNYFYYISIACIIASSILLLSESIGRFVFNKSIIVVDEIGAIGMYMFVVFIIVPLYRDNQHLKVDFFVNKLSKKTQFLIETLLHIFTLLFASIVTYLWWNFLFVPTFESSRFLYMSGIIEWPLHFIATICWAILVITTAVCLIEKIITKNDKNM